MKKTASFELQIDDINNLGCGVGRLDGKVIFVKGAVTGDTVRAEIIKDNKSFCVGRLVEVVRASSLRASESFCSAPLSCGGCVYRHIAYEHEKQIKYNHVRAAFDKAGLKEVSVLPVVSTERISGYRNKAQYPVTGTKNGMRCGFYASKTHNIVPSESCSIQNPRFAEITRAVCEACDSYGISAYDEKSGKGLLRHIYLRIGEATGEVMLCLVVNGRALPHEKELCDGLCAAFPDITGIILNENTANTNVVLGKTYRTLCGKGYIEDVLCGLRFKISPESFYQVNREGAELLYSLAASLACLRGDEHIVDLYCGTGTIGLSMAARARALTGIEIVGAAVECARQNAKQNNVQNAEFFCADAGSADEILRATNGKRPDVVIIDPPRKGSTRALAECLADLCVPRVVYVSCDATTLARDCTYFKEFGYEIGEVHPVDMFPRTGHVEAVVSLTRSGGGTF